MDKRQKDLVKQGVKEAMQLAMEMYREQFGPKADMADSDILALTKVVHDEMMWVRSQPTLVARAPDHPSMAAPVILYGTPAPRSIHSEEWHATAKVERSKYPTEWAKWRDPRVTVMAKWLSHLIESKKLNDTNGEGWMWDHYNSWCRAEQMPTFDNSDWKAHMLQTFGFKPDKNDSEHFLWVPADSRLLPRVIKKILNGESK